MARGELRETNAPWINTRVTVYHLNKTGHSYALEDVTFCDNTCATTLVWIEKEVDGRGTIPTASLALPLEFLRISFDWHAVNERIFLSAFN